ncbi:MAG: WbuC family cupin fold metalloprotein [Burkholderiaceae bacterium]
MKPDSTSLGGLILIDDHALQRLATGAAASPRRREHLLLHGSHDEAVQRIVMTMNPGTYLRPHRHLARMETLIVLAGELDLLIFDDAGCLTRRLSMAAAGAVGGASSIVEMPARTWHSVVVSSGQPCTLFEIKPGPHRDADTEMADWAPAEGEAGVSAMQRALADAGPGDRPRA